MKSILNMYGIDFDKDSLVDEKEVLFDVGLSADQPNSLLSTIFSARENARSVRYTISTELWEMINQYYLFVKEYSPEFYQTRGLYDFTVSVSKHCATVRSYLDHTLVHDDIWVFISLGIHLERAAQIIRILSSKLQDIEILTESGVNLPLKQYQWTTTLKVLESFDMHRRRNKNALTQGSTFQFLVSHPLFPRSLAYNLQKVHDLLIQLSLKTSSKDPLIFKSGKLAGYFKYIEYEEAREDLPHFFEQGLKKVYHIHDLIQREYFQEETE
ncbi:MAG: alpha-E domain-containing protein [Bacteroidota bacterium]